MAFAISSAAVIFAYLIRIEPEISWMAVCIFSVSRQPTTVRASWYAIRWYWRNWRQWNGTTWKWKIVHNLCNAHISFIDISIRCRIDGTPKNAIYLLLSSIIHTYIECCRWLHDAAAHKKQLTLYRISWMTRRAAGKNRNRCCWLRSAQKPSNRF